MTEIRGSLSENMLLATDSGLVVGLNAPFVLCPQQFLAHLCRVWKVFLRSCAILRQDASLNLEQPDSTKGLVVVPHEGSFHLSSLSGGIMGTHTMGLEFSLDARHLNSGLMLTQQEFRRLNPETLGLHFCSSMLPFIPRAPVDVNRDLPCPINDLE